MGAVERTPSTESTKLLRQGTSSSTSEGSPFLDLAGLRTILTTDARGRTDAFEVVLIRPLGCIRDGGALDCADARYLDHPDEIELSHDGGSVYVAGLGKLLVLRRDRTTGALSQLPGKAGCIAAVPPYADCTDSRGVNALGLELSRDGRNAYVSDREADAIAIYRRAR